MTKYHRDRPQAAEADPALLPGNDAEVANDFARQLPALQEALRSLFARLDEAQNLFRPMLYANERDTTAEAQLDQLLEAIGSRELKEFLDRLREVAAAAVTGAERD